MPDPARPGQGENDVEADGRTDQLLRLFAVLAPHTATPDDCYFCVWDGFADANVNVDVMPSTSTMRTPAPGAGRW